MKLLRQLGVLLIFILAISFLLSIILPTSQKLEKTTIIHASAKEVYDYLSKLSNFKTVAVWEQRDSLVNYSIKGIDGNIGAVRDWKGDPFISGEGELRIISLEPSTLVRHSIRFDKPRKGEAESSFLLQENNGYTTVTWTFKMKTPRPKNIFNLFSSIDKEMGQDFEQGLAALKKKLEGNRNNVMQMSESNFAGTYVIIRQNIKFTEIRQFADEHWKMIREELSRSSVVPSANAVIVYDWNLKTGEADLAAAVQVPADAEIPDGLLKKISLSSSKSWKIVTSFTAENIHEVKEIFSQNAANSKMKITGPLVISVVDDKSAVYNQQVE